MKKFIKITARYIPDNLVTYKEYVGKPYYEIMYEENGEVFVGFGSFNMDYISEWIHKYFIDNKIDESLEIIDKVIEGQMKQAETFNGNGCHSLAKTHQDQACGAQIAKQAVLRLKEGKE